MRKSATQALVTLIILLLMATFLFTAAFLYRNPSSSASAAISPSIAFLAAGLAVAGQALLAGLAYWGLTLARQQADLATDSALIPSSTPAASSFRMSYGDDSPTSSASPSGAPEPRTLDSGFQRVVIALSGLALFVLAVFIGFVVVVSASYNTRPGQDFYFAPFDQLAIVIALGSAAAAFALQRYTRPTSATAGYADAVHGILTMGLPGLLALAVAVLAEWFKVRWAAETAASILALLLILQAVELIVNAARSYAAIEELDQPPVDLAALPLVPMLTSIWLDGLQSILVQSIGLARTDTSAEHHQPTLLSRMMPRVLVAIVLLLFLMTTLRIVNPGEVAILERLGQAQTEPIIAEPQFESLRPPQPHLRLLQPGLHLTLPWPIDTLVHIPTQAVRQVTVGTEEEPIEINGKKSPVDFAFWGFRHSAGEGGLEEPDFITMDQQLLGTLVSVWWRVKDPAAYYNRLSQVDFYEQITKAGKPDTLARPTSEALIQTLATRAVTQAFAIHPLDAIMQSDRSETEIHTRQLLQDELDTLHSGVQIVDLMIREVHPPIGIGRKDSGDPKHPILGPAAAYEEVVRQREEKERAINEAAAARTVAINRANGDAYQILANAQVYKDRRVAQATGQVLRQVVTAQEYIQHREIARAWFRYKALDEVLPQATKILLGDGVLAPNIWQPSKDSAGPLAPRPTSP